MSVISSSETVSDQCVNNGGRGNAAAFANTCESPRLEFSWSRRLPMIRQSEAAECGLACLAMIAGYYGNHIDLATLRTHYSLSLKGMRLPQLVQAAESLDLACRPLRLELDEVGQLQTPCLLHWDMDHFVVLARVRKGRVVIHDPALGVLNLRMNELGPHWTGVAVELSKGPDFKRKPVVSPVSLRKLAGSIHGLGKALVVIFSLALLLEIISLLWPQFLQVTIDQVLADSDNNLLTLLGVSFVLLLLIQTTVSALRTWTVMWLGMHFNFSWVGNVFQHLMSLPQAYFMKRHLGDIVSRFGAVGALQQTITTQFVGTVLDGVMVIPTIVVMLIYSRMLTSIVLFALVIYGLIRVLYYRVYFESNLSQITTRAKQQSVFMEAARGVQTIRLHNQAAAYTGRYLNATANALNTSIKVQKLKLLFSAANGITKGGQRVVVLWLGAWLALNGRFSAGMLMAYTAYADQLTSRASSLIEYLVQLKLMRLQGERLADIVMTTPEPHTDGQWVGPEPEPSIRFEHVSFCYGTGEPPVLDDVSLEIKVGEKVAITGPSGGGKSTLVRLLLGLVEPQQGRISIGGVDIKQIGKRFWRDMAGAVLQNDTLFAGTISDNISFNDEESTPEKVEAAARLAQIHEDIIRMPMGYHTIVGDMGSALSGGQKQRLTIARAIYKQPKVLVFDEATSHLDLVSEKKVLEGIAHLNLTSLIIAHRFATLQSADRVLVCINGKVSIANR